MEYLRSYSELITLPTFSERLDYLRLNDYMYDSPRDISYGFYKSTMWRLFAKSIRQRDLGFDLGVMGIDIRGKIIVHHINPVTEEDILIMSPMLMDPENVISTSVSTHNIIHYGHKQQELPERKPGDTKLW